MSLGGKRKKGKPAAATTTTNQNNNNNECIYSLLSIALQYLVCLTMSTE
jgi:hypothetical protein